MSNRSLFVFTILLISVIFSGCVQSAAALGGMMQNMQGSSSTMHLIGNKNESVKKYGKKNIKKTKKRNNYTDNYLKKKEKIAKRYMEEIKKIKGNDLIWNYNMGTMAFWLKKYSQSLQHFNRAESLIKKYDEEVLRGKVADVGSLFSNDRFMEYRPRIYEKIMVNTFKGMDYLIKKDRRNARIEFNRALVRQTRARKFFEKEIAKEKKSALEEQKKKIRQCKKKKCQNQKKNGIFSISDFNKKIFNKKTIGVIEKHYTNLFAFKPYRDFVNPFTTYLAGIYFLNVRDYRKAANLLKETYGMIHGFDNGEEYVRKDLALALKRKKSLRSKSGTHLTWVIFLNGEAPVKDELRIDVPLFLFTGNVFYTGIAFPTLTIRDRAFKYLSVNGAKTKRVASMDNVIKAEFKKRFRTIMLKALMRTATETVISKQLQDKMGVLGALAGAAYQFGMNRADTRMWSSLPKEFQVVRVPTKSRMDIMTPAHKKVASLKMNPKKNYIVFVTMRTAHSDPIISYQSF